MPAERLWLRIHSNGFFHQRSLHACSELDGSGLELFRRFGKHGPMYLFNNWPSPVDPVAWKLLGSYAVFQLALMRLVPGKRFEATTTATGHT